jgi:hypothetical protein
MQVWISFGIAVLVCGTGLAWLPGGDLDRAFMVMGYFFCLSSAFALSKYVRDNAIAPSDTPMWAMVVWGGFALSMALTAWGLWRMEINPTWKAYLLVSWLYLISSAFTLAKTLRDAYEADRLERAQEPGLGPAGRRNRCRQATEASAPNNKETSMTHATSRRRALFSSDRPVPRPRRRAVRRARPGPWRCRRRQRRLQPFAHRCRSPC